MNRLLIVLFFAFISAVAAQDSHDHSDHSDHSGRKSFLPDTNLDTDENISQVVVEESSSGEVDDVDDVETEGNRRRSSTQRLKMSSSVFYMATVATVLMAL